MRRPVVLLQKVLCNSLTPSTFNSAWDSNKFCKLTDFNGITLKPPSKGNRRDSEIISITEIFHFIRGKQPGFRRSNGSAHFRYERMIAIYPMC